MKFWLTFLAALVSTTAVFARETRVRSIDIDVKLDRPGELRLNLFSHSADEYTSYLDYSQRNGVGITYQKEFNKWSDFVRSLFRSRKKRQQMEKETAVPEEKRTITVEADE